MLKFNDNSSELINSNEDDEPHGLIAVGEESYLPLSVRAAIQAGTVLYNREIADSYQEQQEKFSNISNNYSIAEKKHLKAANHHYQCSYDYELEAMHCQFNGTQQYNYQAQQYYFQHSEQQGYASQLHKYSEFQHLNKYQQYVSRERQYERAAQRSESFADWHNDRALEQTKEWQAMVNAQRTEQNLNSNTATLSRARE